MLIAFGNIAAFYSSDARGDQRTPKLVALSAHMQIIFNVQFRARLPVFPQHWGKNINVVKPAISFYEVFYKFIRFPDFVHQSPASGARLNGNESNASAWQMPIDCANKLLEVFQHVRRGLSTLNVVVSGV